MGFARSGGSFPGPRGSSGNSFRGSRGGSSSQASHSVQKPVREASNVSTGRGFRSLSDEEYREK